MNAIAERAHVGREHLHKALASGAEPRYYTVLLNSHGSSPVGSPIKESRDAEFWSQAACYVTLPEHVPKIKTEVGRIITMRFRLIPNNMRVPDQGLDIGYLWTDNWNVPVRAS